MRPHVAHLDLARRHLVGPQHGHSGRPQLVGQLELSLQAAMLVIHLDGQPRIAARLNKRERRPTHGIVHARHEHVAARRRCERMARRLKREHAALVSERPAEARRGTAAHLFGQLVVAPATADGVLAAHALGHLHLEHGARVVVEPAHERGVLHIGEPCAVKVGLHGFVMLAALVAQVVGDLRRALHDGGAAGILAVERAQRVDLGTAVALVAQLVRMRGHVRPHGLPIRGTARIAAHRVHQKTRGFRRNADGREEAHEHDDALGVHARLLSAQALDAHLVELALATLLRALGAKHRARVHELGGRGPLRHQIVLHHSAHDAGGALGAQAQAALRLHGAAAKKRGQVLAGNGREHLL